MLTVTVTNTTDASLNVSDIYTTLNASGDAGDAVTFTRSQAQLDSMQALKTLLNAGSVTVDVVPSTDNEPGMSIPTEQFGTVGSLAVSGVAIVTSAVTFPFPYDSTVTPNVSLTVVQGTAQDFKANTYVRSLTHTGFTIALDVTTAGAGGHVTSVNWSARG